MAVKLTTAFHMENISLRFQKFCHEYNFIYEKLMIIDALGREVKAERVEEVYDIYNLPNGFYTVILVNSENEKRYVKIIKE